MNRITALAASVAVAASTLAVAPAAVADTYEQVCAAAPGGRFYAHAIETDADRAALNGYDVRPFIDTAAGCSSYGVGFDCPVPDPIVRTEVLERIVRVEVPVEVVRTVEVPVEVEVIRQVVVGDANASRRIASLERKTRNQAATIARLRARLAR